MSLTNPIVGEMQLIQGNEAPHGWAFANGQLISIEEAPALYELIGYQAIAGPDFPLPNVATSTSRKYIIALQGEMPQL